MYGRQGWVSRQARSRIVTLTEPKKGRPREHPWRLQASKRVDGVGEAVEIIGVEHFNGDLKFGIGHRRRVGRQFARHGEVLDGERGDTRIRGNHGIVSFLTPYRRTRRRAMQDCSLHELLHAVIFVDLHPCPGRRTLGHRNNEHERSPPTNPQPRMYHAVRIDCLHANRFDRVIHAKRRGPGSAEPVIPRKCDYTEGWKPRRKCPNAVGDMRHAHMIDCVWRGP